MPTARDKQPHADCSRVTVSVDPDRGVLRPIWRLAAPVMLGQTLNTLVGFVDMYLAGQFLKENAYLAAINLMVYLLWIFPNLFAAIAIGATALVARFTGSREHALRASAVQQAFLLGLWVVGPAVAVIYFGSPSFVALMQLEGEAAPLATRYLLILVWALPAMMIEEVGIACLHGAGDTVSEFVAKAVVNLVNLALSFALLTGWGVFPKMGFTGLALGTAIAHGIGAVVILGCLLGGRAGLRLRLGELRPDWLTQRRLMRIGLPGFFDVAALLLCQLWFVAIVNSLGTAASAAHGVGIRIESLAYIPGMAFQIAATSLTGQYLGAGSPRMARKMAMACIWLGGGVMTAVGGLFFVGADFWPALLVSSENHQALELAAPLLRVVAFSMPTLAITMVLGGVLRGAGDTRWLLAVTLLGFLCFRIPLAYFLTHGQLFAAVLDNPITGWNLGVLGAWLAMVIDISVRGALVLARFLHGGWSRIEV